MKNYAAYGTLHISCKFHINLNEFVYCMIQILRYNDQIVELNSYFIQLFFMGSCVT